jgi:diketogulonate reductase-like aldo/keto reductase
MGSIHRLRKRDDGEINEALVQLVVRAIQTGYMHIDTAVCKR